MPYTHLPNAMVKPLKPRFTQIKFTIHSKPKQIAEGIFCDGSDKMAICMQISGRLTTLMRWCSLISLKEKPKECVQHSFKMFVKCS